MAGTILKTNSQIEELIALFERVASEQGWCPGEQLSAYVAHSVYFGVRDDGRMMGGIQLVHGGHEILPCLTVWPELALGSRDDVADIAMLALVPEARGSRECIWLLAASVWRYCADHGVSELWAELTPRKLRAYQRIGWPFEAAGPLREHWGEHCYPCRMTIADGLRVVADRAGKSVFFEGLLVSTCPEYEELRCLSAR